MKNWQKLPDHISVDGDTNCEDFVQGLCQGTWELI